MVSGAQQHDLWNLLLECLSKKLVKESRPGHAGIHSNPA